jgi:RNA polymerase sigma-70 factor, ECF subfamily
MALLLRASSRHRLFHLRQANGCDFPGWSANHIGVNTHSDIQAQFVALLQIHRALLCKIVRVYARSPADRDDLAQEAIANLWRAYPRYDDRLKFSTWMYRVVLNVAISWQRRERTQTQHLVPAGEEVLEMARSLEAPAAADDGDLVLLYSSIATFDALDKALLILYLDGLTHPEISVVLGITSTNIATKIGRLKDRLREDFRAAGRL